MPDTSLYFAYTALLAPERMSVIAPGARFMFSAHFPATKLRFVANGSGTFPTLAEDPDHTVWGAVFSVSGGDLESITAAEKSEGRQPGWDKKAVDREGNKHECVTFVGYGEGTADAKPDRAYVDDIISGARHWKLPAGWIVGLEDLFEDQMLL